MIEEAMKVRDEKRWKMMEIIIIVIYHGKDDLNK
jgi:hypothetical protein